MALTFPLKMDPHTVSLGVKNLHPPVTVMDLLASLKACPSTLLFILYRPLTHSLDHPMYRHRRDTTTCQLFHCLLNRTVGNVGIQIKDCLGQRGSR